jgi:heat shock protein HslJ
MRIRGKRAFGSFLLGSTALVGALALGACTKPPPAQDSPVGSWRVTGYLGSKGFVPVVPESPVQLTFAPGGRLSGRACNIFGGTWSVSGDSIKVRAEWMTEMACVSEPAMEQEAHFLQALQGAAHWRVNRCPRGAMCFAPDSLVLTDAAGNNVVTAFVGGTPSPGPVLPPDTPVSSAGPPTAVVSG